MGKAHTGTNMISKKFVSVILMLLLLAMAYAVKNKHENSTREASLLLKEYVSSTDDDQKKSILNRLSSLYHDDPENINVVRMYIVILSSTGEYKKAIFVLESFNRKNENPSLLLHECMLKDRIGDYEESCYRKVISLKKAHGINDADYIVALFMVGDKGFDKEKDIYMKGRDDNDDLNIFENKKEDILKELFPN